MSLFFRSEQRSAAATDGMVGGFATGSLSGGSMKSALRVVPVYAATSMVADSLSTLPLAVTETDRSGRRTVPDEQPQLIVNPNPHATGTRIDWMHQCVTSMKLRGNAYGVIVDLDRFGIPSKIKWLNPDSVHVDESGPLPVYLHNGHELETASVVHMADYTLPGSVVGLSPVQQFRVQIDMALSAQDFGSRIYRSSGMPSGHLKNTAKTLDTAESIAAKSRFKASVANNDVFVSGNDWTYDKIGLTPADVQFLDSIKATANQIAAIYKVPPEEIGGEAGSSLTYSTVELNQLKFTLRALQPTAVRIEHHLNRLLRPGQQAKFNLNANVRGDLKSRMDAYAVGLKNGIYTLEQVRDLEDFEMLSAQEIEQWQAWYGAQSVKGMLSGESDDGEATRARALAEIVQKIYLGVGTVLTLAEAREIVNQAGGDLAENLTTLTQSTNGGASGA